MITGVVLTHNEEANVVACLEYLRPHVGEIILVDTESTDRTIELARPLVDKVLTHAHVANFDGARNIAISEARYDWIWFVDADEHIPVATGEIVNRLIRERGNSFEAINIPFKSHFCGQWMQHCGWWPGYTCPRVLKRGHAEFSHTLHGGVKLNGREIRIAPSAETGIDHYSSRDLHHYLEKINRYTTTEALQLAERGFVYDWRDAIQMMVRDLWEHYEYHDARRDGERGWTLTWMAGQYRWLSYTKLLDLEAKQTPDQRSASVPESLDEVFREMESGLAYYRKLSPQLPLGVRLRVALWGENEWSCEGRLFAKALACGVRTVAVDPFDDYQENGLAPEERGLLKAFTHARRPMHSLCITQWKDGLQKPPDDTAVINVARLADPPVDLSKEALSYLDRYDEAWLRKEENITDWRRLGLAPERMRVLDISSVETPAKELEQRVRQAEMGLLIPPVPQIAQGQICVEWEGEFFAGHSFSNINEAVAIRLCRNPSLAVSLRRVRYAPTHDRGSQQAQQIRSYFERPMERGPQVTVRHSFPPNWKPPATGRWVHIQPWEFGSLPVDWLEPLAKVDEIWVMSRYVEKVYRNSGIPPEKLRYIPWGVEADVFSPDVPPRSLPTSKNFRFLFVGGTIGRKGFDRLLDAFLAEFTAEDDVCLVIKDMGASTFYAPHSLRDRIFDAQNRLSSPEILYLDNEMTSGQLASLYTSCQCLVAPYRGEGFGLPILEAMACGLPPIVPAGGATDDFVSAETAFLLPSRVVENDVPNLCCTGTELFVQGDDLRTSMRAAWQSAERTRDMGRKASQFVRQKFTWDRTADLMVERLRALAEPDAHKNKTNCAFIAAPQGALDRATKLTAVVVHDGPIQPLAGCLARLVQFVDQTIVIDRSEDKTATQIAEEYGAVCVNNDNNCSFPTIPVGGNDWMLFIYSHEFLTDESAERLRQDLKDAQSDCSTMCIYVVSRDGHENSATEARIRMLRSNLFAAGTGLLDMVAESISRPVVGRSLITVIPQSVPTSPRIALSEAAQRLFSTLRVDASASPNDKSAHYGRLKKGVLIQLADGLHVDLLERTREHHRKYAERHGMDYLCMTGNPTNGRRAAWGKISLLRGALNMGYERAVWLDADAVVVLTDVDLSRACTSGIGMVRHPSPEHWNSGMIVVHASSAVERFLSRVEESPDNGSAWMEQWPINELAREPEFSSLLHSLDIRFNSVPGFATSEAPVVVAAHGMPLKDRHRILDQCLTQLHSGIVHRNGVRRREEFGAFFNDHGLLGEGAEIGVQEGRFAQILLDTWHGRKLHLVDPWRHLVDYHDISNISNEEHEYCLKTTRENLRRHVGRYAIHRMLSHEAACRFADDALDFVYIDANHAYEAVLEDMQHWFSKLRTGGVLAGHDYLDGDLPEGHFRVKSAVKTFARKHQLEVYVTQEVNWPSWYLFKTVRSSGFAAGTDASFSKLI